MPTRRKVPQHIAVLRAEGSKEYGVVLNAGNSHDLLIKLISHIKQVDYGTAREILRPIGRGKYWTAQKEQFVMKHYKAVGPAAIARKLSQLFTPPCTKNMVISRYHKLLKPCKKRKHHDHDKAFDIRRVPERVDELDA